jgi:hypothetical protein
MKNFITLICILFFAQNIFAQKPKPKVSISGNSGVTYEGYGLDLTPGPPTPRFYNPRRPWNLVRFNFNPVVKVGKWTIPANFNFSPMQTNFVIPGVPGGQSFWQFLTNPMNNFGLNPKKGNTEILLGTQYVNYSELSTGDLGIFGVGASLTPGKFRVKLFTGVSQRPVNFAPPSIPNPLGTVGSYQRNHILAQVGMEKEDKYFVGFNFAKSKDRKNSVTPSPIPALFPNPLGIDPQENMVVTFLAKTTNAKGWGYHVELGQSFLTRDLLNPTPYPGAYKIFKPIINQNVTTVRDNAILTGITKKGKDWEVGAKLGYYGAGYYTASYPFHTNDRLEYNVNTKFNAWKKKMNVVAAVGQRFGNWNNTIAGGRTTQIIANVNVFTQFNDRFSVNANFNNFGFNTPAGLGYKSVTNELSINPNYNWNTKNANHLLSATYTWSKYDETFLTFPGFTKNNTQTALLMYVPSYFNRNITPDFSVMYFKNKTLPTPVDITMWNFSTGLGWKVNKKLNVKGQLQFNNTTVTPTTDDNNLLASSGFDYSFNKKLSLNYLMTANVFKYGSSLPGGSLIPAYTAGKPMYTESTVRTGLQYKF